MLIGIDGGGSKNDLLLFTEEGRVLNRLIAAGTNAAEMGADPACDRLIGQIERLLAPHGGMRAPIRALFSGLSGGGNAQSRTHITSRLQAALPGARHVATAGDTVTALYAGIGVGDGIAVIAGTGTSELVRHNGEFTQIGGWGHLIDDAGSGFWLGREALNAALREMDGRGGKTLLTDLINHKLGADVRSRIPQLYQDGKRTIASFAPEVFSAADKGDKTALDILSRAADELALLIRTGAMHIAQKPWRVALVGSLWNAPLLRDEVRGRLGSEYELTPVTAPAVLGSALAAAELAGLPADDALRNRLIEEIPAFRPV